MLFDISDIQLHGPGCAVYGPSGIGKSTFLRALARGVAETSFDSVNFTKIINFHSAIDTIRYIPQHPPRFELTVKHFLNSMLEINSCHHGCSEELERIIEVLDIASILPSKMNDISAGQLHRVHLASALSSAANLLLLDEPSAALDDDNTMILMDLLMQYINKNGFVICCTHDAYFRSQATRSPCWQAVDFPNFKPLSEKEA